MSVAAAVDSNVTCNALSDGGATASPSGGTAAYNFLWSNAATTASITGVAAGTYTVTVTDANGCTATNSTTVTEPAKVTTTSQSSYTTSSTSSVVKWVTNSNCVDDAVVRYRKLGNSNWMFQTLLSYKDSVELMNLIPSTSYEWRVQLKHNGMNAPLSIPDTFITPCGKPFAATMTSAYATNGETAVVKWNNAVCADNAVVRYRPAGTGSWKFEIVNPYKDSAIIMNLMPTTDYEWRVQLEYQGLKAPLSLADTFTTLCGTEPQMAVNLNATSWLDGNGNINASLTWNSNGCPKDMAIVRYRPAGSSSWKFHTVNPYADSTVIDNLLSSQTYEWKVVLIKNNINSKLSGTNMFVTGCGATPNGLSNTSEEVMTDSINIGKFVAKLMWSKTDTCPAQEVVVRYRKLGVGSWSFYKQTYSDSLFINDLDAGSVYEWRVVAKNGSLNSPLSLVDTFNTPSLVIKLILNSELSLISNPYPNPFNKTLNISINSSENQHITIQLYDLQGRLVESIFNGKIEGKNVISYSNDKLETGVFFIKVISNQSVNTHRIVKQ